MAYCVVEDVRKILSGTRGADSDVNANMNANSLDDDQIEYAISDADQQINSALRKKYFVPILVGGLAPGVVPAEIFTLSVNIASYNAYLIYRQDREFASPLASVILRYQRATVTLTGISDGTVELPIDEMIVKDDLQTVFNAYDGPLFPSSNIFNAPEGYIPPDWVYR